jgi:hypothetical protein
VDLTPKRLLRKWPPRLHQPGPPRLWKIGYALTACFVVALAGLVALWLAALALLSHPKLPQSKVISLHDTVGVAQLVFASVAGAGALVALVMAYRRQRVAETATAHDRTRVLNERFTTIAGLLGDDQAAAMRLAGVHAMAGLADDWEENRQTCVDVLCAYLRLPYEHDPGDEAPAAERFAIRAIRQIRQTVIRVIAAHLQEHAAVSWQGLVFDFSSAVFDGGDFSGAVFSGGEVRFSGAEFSGGWVGFIGAKFSGAVLSFDGAQFSGCQVDFSEAEFSGAEVRFHGARFSGGRVTFDRNQFSGGLVIFDHAQFSGGLVIFDHAQFSGGVVDFSGALDWSHRPKFGWAGTPPAGVKLPAPTTTSHEPLRVQKRPPP